MAEKLAIVTIDAGSNMTGKALLFPERVGTSSGKGTLAQAIRDCEGLAYDSGRAYRTITLAAQIENLEPGSDEFSRNLQKWKEAGRFGHCDIGLTLDGDDPINEHVLHSVEVSRAVASFGALPEVRRLTKEMKLDWLNSYARESGANLIAFDGRAMRQLVEGEFLGNIDDIQLVATFSMVVDVVEAARRRMAQRGIIQYNQPGWELHPKLNDTIEELTERARQDESRTDDPVSIPEEHYLYAERRNKGRLELTPMDSANLDMLIMRGTDVLVDTTGVGINEVQKAGINHILRALRVLDGFDSTADKLEENFAKLKLDA